MTHKFRFHLEIKVPDLMQITCNYMVKSALKKQIHTVQREQKLFIASHSLRSN